MLFLAGCSSQGKGGHLAPRPGRGARKRAQRAAVRVALASPKDTEAPVARLPLLTGAATGPLGVPVGVASRGSGRCRPYTASPCFGTVCCACPVTGSSPLCALESPDWMQTGGGLCVHPAPERRGERWSSVAFPPPERSCHQTRGPLLIWLGEPTGGHEAFVFAVRAESARGV